MEISVVQSGSDHSHFSVSSTELKKAKKWWHAILVYVQPSGRQINRYVTQIFCVIFLYAILYGMLGEDALPGSAIFALLVIVIAAFLGGKLVGLLQLPPLIGMLIVGILFRNIKEIPYYHHIPRTVITDLWDIALSVILLRDGISLDGEALKKLKFAVLRLTLCPELIEVVSMGILGHFILGLPFIFSFMLGFISSNVSPEVLLPPLLAYERQGYGVKKGIPALVIGATSLDDIVAITGFTICFSKAFSTKGLLWTVFKALLEPFIGFVLAAVFGILFWNFPSAISTKWIRVYYNVLMVVLGSMAAMFLSHRLDFAGAGPLTCIILGFVASIKWRKDPQHFSGVYNYTVLLWDVVQPILFFLIGAEITTDNLQYNAGWAILVLLLSLFIRSIMTYFIASGCNLNRKEKLFICCALLPKASIQTVIGSKVLDYAREYKYPEVFVEHSLIVLNVCVLSLLLTAPLAATLVHFLGPYLLTKDSISRELSHYESSESSDEEAISEGRKLESDYSPLHLARRFHLKEQENYFK